MSCNPTISNNSSSSDNGPKLGDELILSMEDTYIASEDLHLKVIKVQDSRCPLNTNCIQAGKGKVFVEIKKGNTTETKTLEAKGSCHETDGSCGKSINYNGYKITLITLTPYPGDDGVKFIKQENYRAKVVVKK